MSYPDENPIFSSTCPPVLTQRQHHHITLSQKSNDDSHFFFRSPNHGVSTGPRRRPQPTTRQLNIVGRPLTTTGLEIPGEAVGKTSLDDISGKEYALPTRRPFYANRSTKKETGRTEYGGTTLPSEPTRTAVEKERRWKAKIEKLAKQVKLLTDSERETQTRQWVEERNLEEERARFRLKEMEWEARHTLLLLFIRDYYKVAEGGKGLPQQRSSEDTKYLKDSELLRRLYEAENRVVELERESRMYLLPVCTVPYAE